MLKDGMCVLNIYVLQEVAQECQDMNWGVFKSILTDALIDHLHPIQVSPSKYDAILITFWFKNS